MNKTFHALLDEAAFTKEMLASGVTQIRKANYASKGYYFQAFTSLSTGLERIGKLCLLLDYYIKNDGRFPDLAYLKNEIRHDLQLLYEKSKEVIDEFQIELKYLPNLEDPIHQNILKIISDFAKGDRYSNIDYLVTNIRSNDPISEWHISVDRVLFDQKVSTKKKNEIGLNSQIVQEVLGSNSLVMHSSESRDEITDLKTASYLTGMSTAIAGLRQFNILQIIRYWTELLNELQYLAMGHNKQEIPFMGELFAIFNNEDNYLKTRKDFQKN